MNVEVEKAEGRANLGQFCFKFRFKPEMTVRAFIPKQSMGTIENPTSNPDSRKSELTFSAHQLHSMKNDNQKAVVSWNKYISGCVTTGSPGADTAYHQKKCGLRHAKKDGAFL